MSGISLSAGGIPIPARARRRVSFEMFIVFFFFRIQVTRDPHPRIILAVHPNISPVLVVPCKKILELKARRT